MTVTVCNRWLAGMALSGALGLFVYGMNDPWSYSHTEQYVVLSAFLSFRMYEQ